MPMDKFQVTLDLVLLPDIRRVGQSQGSIIAILLLPFHKAAFEHTNLLFLALFRAKGTLTLPSIAKGSRRATLLAECTVEDYLLGILESSHELRHADIKGGARNPS
jgi:hypothetical protein